MVKAYPKYKSSGVAWMGQVPEHWQRLPGRACFYERKLPNTGLVENQVLSLSYGHIVIKPEDKLHGLVPESFDTYQIIEPLDIICRPTDLQNDRVSLRFGISRDRGIITAAYICLRTKNRVLPEFGYLLLHTYDVRKIFYGLGSGLRQNLDWVDFKYLPFFVPPVIEQEKIIDFVHAVNHSVNRYLKLKRAIIKLLNEQKQAIIKKAVSRGINPNVRLKSSGVDWLGDIPEHWDVTRVKNEFLCMNSKRIPLSGTQRGAMTLREYDYYGASGIIDKVDDYLFDDELLLIAEDGANLVLRNLPLAIIARGKFWVNNHAHILKPKRGNIEYLASVMESMSFLPWISGAAQPKLTRDRLMGIPFAIAPPEEQDVIIDYVKKLVAPFTETIISTQREIKLVVEYRDRLISDVLTGKEDIRGVKLPEIREEFLRESIDEQEISEDIEDSKEVVNADE